TVAAVPGGIQADAGVRTRMNDFGNRTGENFRANARDLKDTLVNVADSLTLTPQLVPAYAGVGSRFPGTVFRPEPVAKPEPMYSMGDGAPSWLRPDAFQTRIEPPVRFEDVQPTQIYEPTPLEINALRDTQTFRTLSDNVHNAGGAEQLHVFLKQNPQMEIIAKDYA